MNRITYLSLFLSVLLNPLALFGQSIETAVGCHRAPKRGH